MTIFTEQFGRFACDGDIITATVDGFTLTARLHDDDAQDAPWDRSDGHGPVSEWTSRAEAPGEKVLATDRGSHRLYDYAAALKLAKRDGWGTGNGRQPGETANQYAARAVDADYEALRGWCNDEWRYVGVAVTVSRNDVQLTEEYSNALWGVDCNYPGSDNSYLTDVANELAPEALSEARATLAKLCECEPA